MVVDDQPVNVKLLERKLTKAGLNVISAFSGQECLEKVLSHKPQVILLDVIMPDMDGITTCRELKKSTISQDIPVIFITARNSKEGKIEGLDAGAADYITKPIDLDETLARVQTQLRIRENHNKNLELEKRLADARQNAAVGHITEGIAHNLNNLLGVISGYLDLLKRAPDKQDRVIRSSDMIGKAVQRMVKIVQQLSTIASNEVSNLSTVDLKTILNNSLLRFHNTYRIEPPIKVENETPEDFSFETNIEGFEDCLSRILINAYESYPDEVTAAQRNIIIHLSLSEEFGQKRLLIEIQDHGKGIDPEVEEHMFEPFVSGHSTVGRGLGLTVSRHIIRSLGGDLRLVANTKDTGTTAMISLPITQ
jgi:DNA-binding response OmpR family regulator